MTTPAASSVSTPVSSVLNPPSTAVYKDILTNFKKQLENLHSNDAELLSFFNQALQELDTSTIKSAWYTLITSMKGHFTQKQEKLFETDKDTVALLSAQARLCQNLASTLHEEFSKSLGNSEPHYSKELVASFETWERLIAHFQIQTGLPKDLQRRIQHIVSRNLNTHEDDQKENLVSPTDEQSKRLKNYQVGLEFLFKNRFTPLVYLGSGAVKTVYAVHEKSTNKVYSVGIVCLLPFRKYLYHPLEKELTLNLSGEPGILETFEIQEGNKPYNSIGTLFFQGFVQELMDGDLYTLVKSFSHLFLDNPVVFKKMVSDLLTAAVTLEKKSVLHGDISFENYLYRIDDNGALTVKLMDFGFAQSLPSAQDLPIPLRCSYLSRAPEFIDRNSTYKSHKLDVYSVGMMLYLINFSELHMNNKVAQQEELVLFKAIEEATSSEKSLAAKINPKWFPNAPLEESAKGTLLEVAWHMLQRDPTKRFTAAEALDAVNKIYGAAAPQAASSS